MKAAATGMLLFAAGVYAVARWQQQHGEVWAGYLGAAAEAAMVGALADWFAVTALFRHPLGLPIPHTAIIPKRKAALGRSLSDFVGENFLSPDVVRTRLRAVGLSARAGAWLADPEHADRVAREAAGLTRAVLAVLRDDEVQDVLGGAVNRWLAAQPLGPPAGALLERFTAQGGHRPLIDLLARRAAAWLTDHPEAIERAVESEAPGWTPRFIDERLSRRIHRDLVRMAEAVRDEPDHAARRGIDAFLADFARDLRSDPDMMAQAERLKTGLLEHPEVQHVVGSIWQALRSLLISGLDDDEGQLRGRVRDGVARFGLRLTREPQLRAKVDGWVENAAVYVVSGYRTEITSLISDTVDSWDAAETSRKFELQVGRDLQFIRINGTVVGALAGLLIYTLARIAWPGHS